MIPFFGITPLAPAYVLLSGAVVVLMLGPAAATRSRHWVRIAVSVAALIALALVDVDTWFGASRTLQTHTLIEWPDGPAIVLRSVPFQPLLWGLFVSLLAIVLAGRDFAGRVMLSGQVLILVMAATAFGLLSAGTYRTLAVAVVLFDSLAALWWVLHGQPDRAVGRLLLGVLTSAGIMTLASGLDRDLLGTPALHGDVLFSLVIWLRLGLYPLVESGVPTGSAPPMRQSWALLNLVVGLYLLAVGPVPGVAWPALATSLLHGALAWLEPRHERALIHAAWALAGGVLAAAALGVRGPTLGAASVSVLMSWLVLALMAPAAWHPASSQPTSLVRRWLTYLPLILATTVLIGMPLTIGWVGRIALLQAMWDTRGPEMLALAVVTAGASLSVLYRSWQTQIERSFGAQLSLWQTVGALVAATPFLVPWLGWWCVSLGDPDTSGLMSTDSYSIGAWVGLAGTLLWAVFLGYSRNWLPVLGGAFRARALHWLRLDWLLRRAEALARVLGGSLLRVRSVVEGEHYLAWALLLAVCIGLLFLFTPTDWAS